MTSQRPHLKMPSHGGGMRRASTYELAGGVSKGLKILNGGFSLTPRCSKIQMYSTEKISVCLQKKMLRTWSVTVGLGLSGARDVARGSVITPGPPRTLGLNVHCPRWRNVSDLKVPAVVLWKNHAQLTYYGFLKIKNDQRWFHIFT